MNYCPFCGTRLIYNAEFCSGCGRQVTGEGSVEDGSQPAAHSVSGQRPKTTSIILVVSAAIIAAVIGLFLVLMNRNTAELETKLTYEAVEKAIDSSILEVTSERIEKRLQSYGVRGAVVNVEGERGIVVELPAVDDLDRIKGLIGQYGQLQFRIVEDSKPITEVRDDPDWQETTGDENLKPDKTIILPFIKEMLKLGPTLLTDNIIKETEIGYEESGLPKVDFTLTSEGSVEFAELTTSYQSKQLAIVFNYEVESAPNINEPITGGKAEITGDFTEKEAEDLAVILNSGPLPVELELMKEESI